MATYKLIDGELVNVEDIAVEPKKEKYFNASVSSIPGLTWGKRGYQQKWITANKEGTGRDLVVETKK